MKKYTFKPHLGYRPRLRDNEIKRVFCSLDVLVAPQPSSNRIRLAKQAINVARGTGQLVGGLASAGVHIATALGSDPRGTQYARGSRNPIVAASRSVASAYSGLRFAISSIARAIQLVRGRSRVSSLTREALRERITPDFGGGVDVYRVSKLEGFTVKGQGKVPLTLRSSTKVAMRVTFTKVHSHTIRRINSLITRLRVGLFCLPELFQGNLRALVRCFRLLLKLTGDVVDLDTTLPGGRRQLRSKPG